MLKIFCHLKYFLVTRIPRYTIICRSANPKSEAYTKIKDDHKNKDNPKNVNDPKHEKDPKNEDDPKNNSKMKTTSKMKISPKMKISYEDKPNKMKMTQKEG